MSGPKVVRIVTREEILAICEGHLARVDAALMEWVRVGRRNNSVSDAEVATAESRRDQLRAMLARDDLNGLQKRAPLEIAFLREDQQARLLKVAADAAKARTMERRQSDAARALLAALQRSGRPLDATLQSDLAGIASGHSNPVALAKGFALLSPASGSSTDRQRSLAQNLKDGEGAQSLANWIASQPPPPSDAAIQRLEGRLSELALIAGTEISSPLEARLRSLLQEAVEARRNLLLDSLHIDTGLALEKAKQLSDLQDQVRLVFSELEQTGSSSLSELVTKRAAAYSVEALQSLVSDAKDALARTREEASAQARRAAVLKSLAGLGYEVTEGLSTAWVDAGRVVLRKAAQPNYGVEISGDFQAARVQIRAVAFTGSSAGPDPAQDKDAETSWCGDVSKLQALLADGGGGLVIERALAIGATPLKRLVEPTQGADRHVAREGPSQRIRSHD